MPRTRREGKSTEAVDVGGIAGERLKSFIERIERLSEEAKAIAEDIKEVFAEAKGTGFSPKIMRQVIKIRTMDKDDYDEETTLREVYMAALGMLPLFEADEARTKLAATLKPKAPKDDDDEEIPDAVPSEEDKAAAGMKSVGEVVDKVVAVVAMAAGLIDPKDMAAAERAGRDAYLAGLSVSKPPKFDNEELLKAWDRGYAEQSKESRAQKTKDALAVPRLKKAADVGKSLDEGTPDKQAEAKLAGEVAARAGKPSTANPHSNGSSLFSWWAKGHFIGSQAAKAEGSTVTPIRGSKAKPGYSDKTHHISAGEAAKLLSEKTDGNA